MGVPARTRTATAWVVAALLIGFAPLFHAICIAPIAASASGEVMVHKMADGTVMGSDSSVAVERPVDATRTPHTTAATIDPDRFSERSAVVGSTSSAPVSTAEVGTIVIIVGLAVLTVILFARWRELTRSLGHPPPLASLARARPVVSAWPRAAVNLDALGISRT